ncbi:Wzz/FepE/Etk N-terminal domain-containing protein [Amylibacter sp.]|nr:Wzz/FepE/Etk N-terminal domain-containing protein [Amylibacter sp.]
MQDSLNSKPGDEIDLREFLIFLWAYKLLIVSTCILGISYSLYYFQNAKKIYTSAAIFKLDQEEAMGFSFNKKTLGPLASIAGISDSVTSSELPIDKVRGRVFIQKLDAQINFQTDPYFNTYNPKLVDPSWKSFIKRTIGWPKPSTDVQEAMWQSIVRAYSKNVVLDGTKEGSAKVVVTHVNPHRAAEIANAVMNTIISTAKIKKTTKADLRLSYLSNTLAKALGDLEIAQSRLKEFTLQNSALPLESFAAGSLELDALRLQLKRSTKLHDAVAALSLMLQNKTVDRDDYLELRQQFPIVDQVEFRRVLGQNEIISSWSWPKANSVDAVYDTLSERIKRLQSSIDASQKAAERSSIALATYARLERDARISEATYTVLIEQVKAQSVTSGYQPDNTEVYQYASATINPSAPKRNLILSLGAFLGLFVGITFSFILALCRGVYYSRKSLKTGAQARLTFNVRTLLHLRDRSLNDLNTIFVKKPHPILRDIAVEIHKSGLTQIVVTSLRSRISGDDTARALASYMQSDTMKVGLINFSLGAKKLDIEFERLSVGSFVVSERVGHLSVLRPDSDLGAMELLGQKGFRESIQSLNSTFDLVFLSADNDDTISLLNALEGQKVFHITLARTRKTKSVTLTQMRSILPIQGLLHD